jgi:hypothetical protein
MSCLVLSCLVLSCLVCDEMRCLKYDVWDARMRAQCCFCCDVPGLTTQLTSHQWHQRAADVCACWGATSTAFACPGPLLQEHSRRAAALASRLLSLGAPVTYPGLPSHPQVGAPSSLEGRACLSSLTGCTTQGEAESASAQACGQPTRACSTCNSIPWHICGRHRQ